MSEDHQSKRQLAAEDRAALREELGANKERLEVIDRLSRESDDAEADVPAMPDALREKLLEKFGSPEPVAAPEPKRSTPVVELGFFARLSEFFAQKQVAYGGMALAACALLLAVFLPNGDPASNNPIDTLRGGDGAAGESLEVAVYLFPEDKAAPVMALMNPDRPATLCLAATEVAAGGDERAVAVDLERRVVLTYRDGQLVDETPVEGEGATDLLLGLRAAVDAIGAIGAGDAERDL